MSDEGSVRETGGVPKIERDHKGGEHATYGPVEDGRHSPTSFSAQLTDKWNEPPESEEVVHERESIEMQIAEARVRGQSSVAPAVSTDLTSLGDVFLCAIYLDAPLCISSSKSTLICIYRHLQRP